MSETIIAKELLGAIHVPLVSTVLDMFKSHLGDEARHSRYFSEVFAHVWSLLDDVQRAKAATQLLTLLGIFFESDTRWLKKASPVSTSTRPPSNRSASSCSSPPFTNNACVPGPEPPCWRWPMPVFTLEHNRRLFLSAGFMDA